MEKTINYILSLSGVFPEEALCGGVQGENNATALTFEADSPLLEAINKYVEQGKTVKVKIDAVTASGERVKSETREGEDLFLPFYLSNKVTSSGLDTVVVFRVIIDPDEKELCKAQIKLYFIPSPINTEVADKDAYDELEELAEEIIENVEERAKRIEELMNYKFEAVSSASGVVAKHLKDAERVSREIEETRRTLEEGTVFIFSGGDANSAVEDFVTVDEELSPESENPVQNKVVAGEISSVKEALALRADFVVEQSFDENGWRYRKWQSGLVEMWKKQTIKLENKDTGHSTTRYFEKIELPTNVTSIFHVAVHLLAEQQVGYLPENVIMTADVFNISQSPQYVTIGANRQPAENSQGFTVSIYIVAEWK